MAFSGLWSSIQRSWYGRKYLRWESIGILEFRFLNFDWGKEPHAKDAKGTKGRDVIENWELKI